MRDMHDTGTQLSISFCAQAAQIFRVTNAQNPFTGNLRIASFVQGQSPHFNLPLTPSSTLQQAISIFTSKTMAFTASAEFQTAADTVQKLQKQPEPGELLQVNYSPIFRPPLGLESN